MEKQYVNCQMINGEKYLAGLCGDKQEAMKKSRTVYDLRNAEIRYIVITEKKSRQA